MAVTKKQLEFQLHTSLFYYAPLSMDEVTAPTVQRKYVDPKVKYNTEERYKYYWTKIHNWSSAYEVQARLGKEFRGEVIIPNFIKPTYDRLLQEQKEKDARVLKEYRLQKVKSVVHKIIKEKDNKFDVLEVQEIKEVFFDDEKEEPQFTFFFRDYAKESHEKSLQCKIEAYELKQLVNLCKTHTERKIVFRNQLLLLELKSIIEFLSYLRSSKKRQCFLREKKALAEQSTFEMEQEMKDPAYRQRKKLYAKYAVLRRQMRQASEHFKVQHSNNAFLLKELFKKIKRDNYKNIKFEAQMDSMAAQGEKTCPEINIQGNTMHETQRGASQGIPAKKVQRQKKVYNKLASAESSVDYGALTDRFFPHKVYEWAKSDGISKKIVDLTLPLDFVLQHPNAANCVLFNSYAYWDGDIEVKLMINANKFQVGQLQMAWYYGQDYEENFNRRDNIFTASQQAHCLASASTSNEGILYIPFRYFKPKMGTKTREDDPGRLNMGRLTVRVLNQLSCPSTTFNSCTFTISFRFINSNFSGMIARDLGSLEPNMLSVVRSAMHLMEELDMDPQRDNPPNILPSQSMVPWSAHSWSIGDNLVEPINAMRLSGPGQTPHPAEVTPQFDEMQVSHIVQVFGLIKTVMWKASQRQGVLLFSLDGSPTLTLKDFHYETFDGSLCYAMPPITVLSKLFAYWRGSIELRLDIIASPFHTGRILIAYIPRVMEAPTFEQAKSSPHAIFDLQGENRQFVFTIPYISDRPWWHTCGFGNNILPPSRIYCFVMNELIPMDNVVNEVSINIYMRGCNDFELSIPVSPRIGLSTYNATVDIPLTEEASTKSGYTPVYVGEWREFGNGTKQILRYGNVSDHVVQLDRFWARKIYTPDTVRNGGIICGVNGAINWYIVGIAYGQNGDRCYYAAYFDTLEQAVAFAATQDPARALPYVSDSDWFKRTNGDRVDSTIYFKEVIQAIRLEDYELECNMDERDSVVTTCEDTILPGVGVTGSGMLTFGENFGHLKALCRRYQLYNQYNIELKDSKNYNQRLKIPLLPQGLIRTNEDIINDKAFNYNREGLIPIVASGFRFYRGGLRLRLVWRSKWDCSVRLEHRPDERMSNTFKTVDNDHRSFYNDGYAFLIQNTAVNNVIEFEIPFYQCGVLGLLQHPKLRNDLESYHFSLGNLYISFACEQGKRAVFDLYYSLADDCRFSVFQGFPPMIESPNISLTRMEPQMGLKDVFGLTKTNESIQSTLNKVDTVVDRVKNMLPEATNNDNENIEDKKTSIIEWITNCVPECLKQAMINGISQIMHCFINPTAKTISWAFSSFLVSIGVLCSKLVTTFSSHMRVIINWITRCRGKDETKPDSVNTLEGQMGEDTPLLNAKAGILSTIVTSIAAAMGSLGRMPKNIPDFFKSVWNNLAKFTITSNALCTFFKNNLTWITNAYRWVLSKIMPNRALAFELESCETVFKEFAKEALILTDEVNARKVEFHPRWNMRVYACAATASRLYIKMAQAEGAPKTHALFALMQKILKKRDYLVRFQISPPVRFEPYIMAVFGDSNIGKSHLCQDIAKAILKRIEYKTYEEIIYTRTPGNPYWNQLRNQPVCLYDDFGAIEGEYGLQQAAELFCLKSRAVFNPPQASIEDKHIRYNPLLVFLAMNDPFPKIPGVACTEAFYRRRDILIKVVKDEAFYREHKVDLDTGSPKNFNTKDIEQFQHLTFQVAGSEKDPNTGYGPLLKYGDLLNKIVANFMRFYDREMDLYIKALKEAHDFYPEDDSNMAIFNTEEQNEHIDNINKYRFGSVEELKVFVMNAVSNITKYDEAHIAPIMPLLRTLSIYDANMVKMILDANIHVRNYVFNTPAYLDLKEKYEEIYIITNPSTSAKGKKKTNSSIFIANMLELDKVCVHTSFDIDLEFDRTIETANKEGKYDPGVFFNPLAGVENGISEKLCDGFCIWRDNPDQLKLDMNNWLLNKSAIHRKVYFKNKKWGKLPSALLLQERADINNFNDNFAQKVESETKSWCDWAKNILSAIGNGVWSAIKWGSKIIVVLSAVLGFAGFAYDLYKPEAKAVRLTEELIKKQTLYNQSYQAMLGTSDAALTIQTELANKQHYLQKQYEDLNNEESQMSASGDYKTFGKKDPIKIKDVAIKMVGQMAKEREVAVLRLIKRNTMFIQAHYESKIITGRIVGLVDHYALTVDHYHDKFSKLPEDSVVYLMGNNFKIAIKYGELQYSKFANSSLGYYRLPLQVPAFKDLIKHIARQKDHRHVGPISLLVEPMLEDNSTLVSELYCERVSEVKIDASNGFDAFVIPDGYKYARGGRGVCGSVLVSDHLEHPIYGIHVAGDIGGKMGLSEAVTFEQFACLYKDNVIKDVIEPNMAEWNEGFLSPKSNIQILGIMPNALSHRETGLSKVIPTECNGEIFPVYCNPPVLSPYDERIANKPFSPMQEGVNKHGLVTLNFPNELLELAYEDLRNLILAKVKPVRGKVGKLTKSVAVVGDPYVEGFDKLDLNTSEGFPYTGCRTGQQKSKSWLLNLTQKQDGSYLYNGCDPMLRDILRMKKEQRLSRRLPFTVFVDCLKDRKLPIEKIKTPGKVRIFSISPLDYTIQCRQYCMDFTVSYQNARLDVEHAVGIDVNSFEWSNLAHKLLNNSTHIVTADYSNFGPALNLLCAKKAFDIIRDWYKFNGDDNENNDVVREMLGFEVMYSVHLCFSTVYRTFCGLPSGGPLTVIQNSLVNCLYIRVAWLLAFSTNINFSVMSRASKLDIPLDLDINSTLQSFHKHVVIIVYGDDLIASVSKNVSEYFNCEVISDILREFRIDIKNATKKNEVIKYLTLLDNDTSFLKNNFIPHPIRNSLFLAALDKKSVEDTLNWTFKEWQHKLRDISLEASDATIRSAYGHGPVYFNYVRDKVFSYWFKKNEKLNTPTWLEIDNRNFS